MPYSPLVLCEYKYIRATSMLSSEWVEDLHLNPALKVHLSGEEGREEKKKNVILSLCNYIM